MTLPTLKINKSQLNNNGGTLGFDYMLSALIDSGKFKIEDHNEKIETCKGFRATILYFNDKKIYLDFWEYAAPSHTNEVINSNFDLIIKLQHNNIGFERYKAFVRHKNYFPSIDDTKLKSFYDKIVPWSFFPSKMMMQYLNNEDNLVSLPIEQNGFFCGRNWKCRHDNKKHMDRIGIKYICNENPGERISDELFMKLMLSSKYGIVFPGRSTHVSDSKNRREIDYMMMKKPLLISYDPYYYNPLIPGKHYIQLKENTDINNLDKLYNISDIANNAYEWYKLNATPEGMVNVFLQIMRERGMT